MNKKRLVLSVISILIIMGIGVGVKKHMDNVEEQKQEIKQTEDLIAKDIVSDYKNIRNIDFMKVEYDSNVGNTVYTFKINDYSETFGYSVNGKPNEKVNKIEDDNYLGNSEGPWDENNKRASKLKNVDLNNCTIKHMLDMV